MKQPDESQIIKIDARAINATPVRIYHSTGITDRVINIAATSSILWFVGIGIVSTIILLALGFGVVLSGMNNDNVPKVQHSTYK